MRGMTCGVLLLAAASLSSSQAPPSHPAPVVLELFTSEGCSSCPPADALLSKLARDQGVPGAEVIALGFHVTYWDDLGWKDPFSLRLSTERQQQYSRIFGADRIYTPQAVIDGREEMVGSDETAVRNAIARAAKEPHTRISIQPTFAPDAVRATLVVPALPAGIKEPCDLLFFVTEGHLTTQVKRGENGGRTLRHDAVVRDMTTVAAIDDKTRFPFEAQAVSKAGRENALRPANPWLVVAVVQGRRSGRIWASGIR